MEWYKCMKELGMQKKNYSFLCPGQESLMYSHIWKKVLDNEMLIIFSFFWNSADDRCENIENRVKNKYFRDCVQALAILDRKQKRTIPWMDGGNVVLRRRDDHITEKIRKEDEGNEQL